MKYLVYKISNSINSKLYIGATKRKLKVRWAGHKFASTKSNLNLYVEMRRYGFDKFNIEIVYIANTENDMFEKEIELIKTHDTTNILFGYNSSTGGNKGRLGVKLTKKHKIYLSEIRKGFKFSNETIMKMKNSAKGRDMTEAVKAAAKLKRGTSGKNVKAVILNDVVKYESFKKASIATGISKTSISNNVHGRSKTTKAGIFKFQ